MSSEAFHNSFMSGMDKLRVRRLYDGLNFEQVNKLKKTCALYFENIIITAILVSGKICE